MSALLISIITFALVLGGALLGMYLRNALTDDHLREDVRDVVRLSTGLIGTIAALVLGLLIASAKSSYDARSTQIKQITANIILLDGLLQQYGPDAYKVRVMLRNAVPPLIDRIWDEGYRAKTAAFAVTPEAQELLNRIQELEPNSDPKRALQARILSAAAEFSTSASVAVHSVTRFNSRAISRDFNFLAHSNLCKLRPVCTSQPNCDHRVSRRYAFCICFNFPDLGNGSAFGGVVADIK